MKQKQFIRDPCVQPEHRGLVMSNFSVAISLFHALEELVVHGLRSFHTKLISKLIIGPGSNVETPPYAGVTRDVIGRIPFQTCRQARARLTKVTTGSRTMKVSKDWWSKWRNISALVGTWLSRQISHWLGCWTSWIPSRQQMRTAQILFTVILSLLFSRMLSRNTSYNFNKKMKQPKSLFSVR